MLSGWLSKIIGSGEIMSVNGLERTNFIVSYGWFRLHQCALSGLNSLFWALKPRLQMWYAVGSCPTASVWKAHTLWPDFFALHRVICFSSTYYLLSVFCDLQRCRVFAQSFYYITFSKLQSLWWWQSLLLLADFIWFVILRHHLRIWGINIHVYCQVTAV